MISLFFLILSLVQKLPTEMEIGWMVLTYSIPVHGKKDSEKNDILKYELIRNFIILII